MSFFTHRAGDNRPRKIFNTKKMSAPLFSSCLPPSQMEEGQMGLLDEMLVGRRKIYLSLCSKKHFHLSIWFRGTCYEVYCDHHGAEEVSRTTQSKYEYEKTFYATKRINSSFVSDSDIATFLHAWGNAYKHKESSTHNQFVVEFAKEVFTVEVDAGDEEFSFHTDIISLVSTISLIMGLYLFVCSICNHGVNYVFSNLI